MKKFISLFYKAIAIIPAIIISSFIYGQPSWSRGIQILKYSHDEGMSKAQAALQAEGYTIQSRGGDFLAGYKNNNTAIIACNATSDGRVYINIFVASTAGNADVPGAERVRLQSQMEKAISNNNNVIEATWSTQADGYRGKNGQRITLRIPPGGPSSGRLWGTDVYTDDSSIGLAAVHAGLITLQNGGTVTIEIREGQASYQSSTRNGLTSTAYASWYGSFVFVR